MQGVRKGFAAVEMLRFRCQTKPGPIGIQKQPFRGRRRAAFRTRVEVLALMPEAQRHRAGC